MIVATLLLILGLVWYRRKLEDDRIRESNTDFEDWIAETDQLRHGG